MGVWGTAIFSDDTACDIRDSYRNLLGDGFSGPQATDLLLDEWHDLLEDPFEAPVFWLALAAIQWRFGRLEQRVQEKALEIIDTGSDLARWEEDAKLLKKRKTVLNKLRERLQSPQPPEKRIPKKFVDSCDWDIGEIICYKLLSGKQVLFRVLGYHVDKGGTAPVFELLEWVGDEIPTRKEMASFGIKTGNLGQTQLMVGRASKNELPKERLQQLHLTLIPEQKRPHMYAMTLWRWLDRDLEAIFNIR